ncbi:MAG: hypothetical protein M1831_004504 [Alyxoria varia]|nr:MAG: hypothetical protein M1831_004504 [Alyxoria varia]
MSLIARRASWLFFIYLVAFFLFCVTYVGYSQRQIIQQRVFPWSSRTWARVKNYTQGKEASKALIVASIKSENTSWIHEYFPDWDRKIYINDDPGANLTIPRQKGRESTTYLTYLIDHWNKLPDYMVFIHGERYQWHNEDPMYDGIPMLQNLRLSYVKDEGFANLRCTTASLGCPDEIKPDPNTENYYKPHYPFINRHMIYAQTFSKVFPNRTLPKVAGAACCSQFAITRAKVMERPKEDYVRYRRILQDPQSDTFITGRAFEYLWHSESKAKQDVPYAVEADTDPDPHLHSHHGQAPRALSVSQ